MTASALSREGRHRWSGHILPAPPDDLEKSSYAWRSLPLLATALFISALCLIVAQAWFEVRYAAVLPFAVGIFATYTAIYFIYQVVSLPVNFAGHSFDLSAHNSFVEAWRPKRYPSVDIFLPICGEPIAVLRNTWMGIFKLVQAYPGDAYVYVLDDGPSEEATALAPSFGFTYVRRPHVRKHKKSGNLNYAFERTASEHIVIFDADFRPRFDFLSETLPYMENPAVGIVQTPQFFRVSAQQTWVERAAGPMLEVFYRAVQVSRDRFGSALCVGSNAVYRRAALAPMGGFTIIPYAEDSHTGLDARYNGYQLTYVPIPLAAGVCPSNLDGFMRQQYRWCCGATSLVWTKHMWRVRMPWKSRLPLHCRLAVEFHHCASNADCAADPDRPAYLSTRRNPHSQCATATPGRCNQYGSVSVVAQCAIQPAGLALGSGSRLGAGTCDLGLCARQGHVVAADTRPGRRDPPVLVGRHLWNGTLAFGWLGLAAWRIEQTGSFRFAARGDSSES